MVKSRKSFTDSRFEFVNSLLILTHKMDKRKRHIIKFLLLLYFPFSVLGQSFSLIGNFNDNIRLDNANGVAVADYDLDGDLDIYLVSSDVLDPENPGTYSRLIRNDGNGGFEDVTQESKLVEFQDLARTGSQGAKMGASWGDYDNDGYPDLFLSNYGFDVLWKNNGDGTFTNVTETAQVGGCGSCYSVNGLWWDYDRDGDLDLYVSDWLKRNRFYQNEGDGSFTDVGEQTELADRGNTWTALPIDPNKDGLMDLYVINDFGENVFYLNNGDLTFTDQTESFGLEDEGDGMGVDVTDFDGDGNLDIYVTNVRFFDPNAFFIDDGSGVFSNQSESLNVDDTGWGWGIRFFDVDHDLDEDLFVVNGMTDSEVSGDETNIFFLNANGVFRDVTSTAGVGELGHSMGLEVFDYDLDGDLDMLVANRNRQSSFYLNRTMERPEEDTNWLQVDLEGTESNRDAFGSFVELLVSGQTLLRYHSGTNLLGQSILPVHFGLGGFQGVDEIVVTWPTGSKEYFPGVDANQLIHLKEGEGSSSSRLVLSTSKQEPAYSVFPNPFLNQLFIKSGENTSGVIFSLYGLSGQHVFSKELDILSGEVVTIETANQIIEPGIYFYRIQTSDKVIRGKILRR